MEKLELIKEISFLLNKDYGIAAIEAKLDEELENIAYDLLWDKSGDRAIYRQDAQEYWEEAGLTEYLSPYQLDCIHEAYLDKVQDYQLEAMSFNEEAL